MKEYINKDDILEELYRIKNKVDNNSSYGNGFHNALRLIEISIKQIKPKLEFNQSMTQEDKELLVKDLSARLPYGVRVKVTLFGGTSFEDTLSYKRLWSWDDTPHNTLYESIRPYLRPMSSMTEEEREEYEWLQVYPGFKTDHTSLTDMFDWLNAHHFDYRGLIPKCLAIEVTDENNPYR